LVYLADLTERVKIEGPANLRVPTLLDVRQAVWPVRGADAIFTANTLHIMSWPEVTAFYRGVGGVLSPCGVLCVYGPFRYDGRYTSDSNREFDQMLQDRDPASGLRDIREVTALALQYGLRLDEDHDLPANNRLLIFIKEPG
jgi:hypothetical protein